MMVGKHGVRIYRDLKKRSQIRTLENDLNNLEVQIAREYGIYHFRTILNLIINSVYFRPTCNPKIVEDA